MDGSITSPFRFLFELLSMNPWSSGMRSFAPGTLMRLRMTLDDPSGDEVVGLDRVWMGSTG